MASSWYDRIDTEISQYTYSLNKGEAKKYKIDLLRRAAKRVEEYSSICGECETSKGEITRIVQELSLASQMPGRQGLKTHVAAINKLVAHLKKEHKLVDKNHYVGLGVGAGMGMGVGLGAVIGSVLDQPGIGTGVGLVLGLIIGRYLDKKAERDGKVI